MVLKLPPFYTARYVEVHSPTLSLVWLLCGLAIVLLTVVHGWFASYSFVERGSPDIDVKMWQDYAVDGSWWPTNATLQREEAGYREDERCGNLKYVSVSETHGTRWGSNTGIKCIAPGETRTPLFYAGPNEINVATSIAYGDNPQYDTDRVFTYRGIELSTIVFAPSFSTDFNVHSVHNVPHVRDCVAMAHDGITPLHNRYRDLHPGETYGAGFLQLSLEDVLAAAGTSLRATGGEGAQPIRLSGLELAAYVDVRNYNDPFSWPVNQFIGFHPRICSRTLMKYSISVFLGRDLLPSSYADLRSPDDVIAIEGLLTTSTR